MPSTRRKARYGPLDDEYWINLVCSFSALLPRQPRSDLLIFRANQFCNLTSELEHLPVPCSPAEP